MQSRLLRGAEKTNYALSRGRVNFEDIGRQQGHLRKVAEVVNSERQAMNLFQKRIVPPDKQQEKQVIYWLLEYYRHIGKALRLYSTAATFQNPDEDFPALETAETELQHAHQYLNNANNAWKDGGRIFATMKEGTNNLARVIRYIEFNKDHFRIPTTKE